MEIVGVPSLIATSAFPTAFLQPSDVEAACLAIGLAKPVAADIATAIAAR